MKKVQITINKKKIKAGANQTILEAAKENGIEIPSLCYHSDLKIKSNCRICLVEIKGRKGLHPSCSTKIKNRMEIITESPKISRARKINLELVFSQHREECDNCIWNFDCQLLALAKKYKVRIDRFIDRKKNYPIYKFGPSIEFDSSKWRQENKIIF
jgi:NADH dehydrogenase/NADH:ubiquinone oxidoreductase subunit G